MSRSILSDPQTFTLTIRQGMGIGTSSKQPYPNDLDNKLRDEFVIPTNRTIKATAVSLDLRSSLDVLPISTLNIT